MANNLPSFFNEEFTDVVGGVVVRAANYQLFQYINNTTTNQQTTSDAAGSVPNANPIILDAAGRCSMFLNPALTYTFVLKTPVASGSATVWTKNDVTGLPAANSTSYVPLAGGTMTGLLVLSGNATANLNPVPLQQVNSLIATSASSTTTIANSVQTATVSAGTSTAYTLTPASALASLAAQSVRKVQFHVASGATPTMAVSGTAATAMKQYENDAKIDARIYAGQVSDIEYDGTHWVIVSPQFGPVGTIANPGSVRLSGGLIMKWGTTTSFGKDTAGNVVTFATAFPTNCWAVIGSPSTSAGVGAGAFYSIGVNTFTTTGFKVDNDSEPTTVTWVAFGN